MLQIAVVVIPAEAGIQWNLVVSGRPGSAFAGMTIKVEGLLEQLEIFTIHTLGLMHQYSIH